MRTTSRIAPLLLIAAGCTLLNDPDDLKPDADRTPPAAPTGLVATAGNGEVSLQWSAVADADFDHYNVQVGTESGVLSESLTTVGTSIVVPSLANETTYYFAITAEDADGNESAFSPEVSATPDGTAPTVTLSPANGATGQSIAIDLVLTFDEPMDRASVEGAVTVTSSPAPPPAVPACAWSWTSGDSVAVCNFVGDLRTSVTYTATVGVGALDVAGNALAAPASAAFTTEAAPDTTPPTVVSTAPVQSASGVYPESNISVTFSEAMNQSPTQTAFQLLTVGGADAAPYRGGTLIFSGDGRTLTYNPPVNFPNGALVTYQVGVGACDLRCAVPQNYLQAVFSGSFRAAYQSVVTIVSTAAADGYMYATTTSTEIRSGATYTGMAVGDSYSGGTLGQFKAFVPFAHTASLQSSTRILSATLSLYQYSCVGTPYDDLDTVVFGKCIDSIFNDCDTDLKARHIDLGPIAGGLLVGDFTAAYLSAGPEVTESATTGWKNKSVTSYVAADRTAGRAYTWFRLEFPVANNSDTGSDYCLFYTADYTIDPALRPKLEVTFETATP